MKLGDYLNASGISQKNFGVLVGKTQGYISHVVVGRHIPLGEVAIAMAAASEWRVTPHELNPLVYPNPTDGMPVEKQSKQISSRGVISGNQNCS